MAGSEFIETKLQPMGGVYDDPIDVGSSCPARPFSDANSAYWSSVGLSPVIPPGMANSPFVEDECNTQLRWLGACEAFAEVQDKVEKGRKGGGLIGSLTKGKLTLSRGGRYDLRQGPESKGQPWLYPAMTEHHQEIMKLALKPDAARELRALMQGDLLNPQGTPPRFYHLIRGYIVVEERVASNPGIVRVHVFSGDATTPLKLGRPISLSRAAPAINDLPGANMDQLKRDLLAILKDTY